MSRRRRRRRVKLGKIVRLTPSDPTTDPKTETPTVAGASHTPSDDRSTSVPFSQLSLDGLPQTTFRSEHIPAPPRRCPKLEAVCQ